MQDNHESPKKSQVHKTQKPKSPNERSKEKAKINIKSRDTERKKWSSKTRGKVQNAGQNLREKVDTVSDIPER